MTYLAYIHILPSLKTSLFYEKRWYNFRKFFNLTRNCINFETDQILIKDPKNKSNRYAFMTAEFKEMLERRYQGQLNSLVFTDRKGNKIKEVSNAFARAVEEVGLNKGIEDKQQRVFFHTLRHTYASWLVEICVIV